MDRIPDRVAFLRRAEASLRVLADGRSTARQLARQEPAIHLVHHRLQGPVPRRIVDERQRYQGPVRPLPLLVWVRSDGAVGLAAAQQRPSHRRGGDTAAKSRGLLGVGRPTRQGVAPCRRARVVRGGQPGHESGRGRARGAGGRDRGSPDRANSRGRAIPSSLAIGRLPPGYPESSDELAGAAQSWRRGWDSNPRISRSAVFKTAPLDRSGTSPRTFHAPAPRQLALYRVECRPVVSTPTLRHHFRRRSATPSMRRCPRRADLAIPLDPALPLGHAHQRGPARHVVAIEHPP